MRGVLLYGTIWVAVGAAIVVFVLITSGGESEPDELPPVQQTRLDTAAARAGCELARVSDRHPGNPPAGGAPGPQPATPGVYDESPPPGALVAALRRGTVVVHYHPRVEDEIVDQLEALRASVPRATIVTPNATRMTYDVAITAYHRVLACRKLTATALDALRLFRGRYLGSGPDG
jgi:hypothetical protein